ncbi:site-specific integrase [Virgibacillus salarius]|uniref:site-specific integrase n=1 Tax=Virgibacillus salarius TaxID=447199 RepID=UPI00249362FF|nr:site-specific integrase [Virgibacillus salarius]WBX81337.1 site-specific integrase [Virgibacillus salarius]
MKGSIIKRGNKYSFVIDIGRDPVTRKRKQKRVSGFTTEKKAEEAMIDMIAELNKGGYVEPSTERLADYLDSWLAHKKKRVVHSTYLHYKGYVNNHIKPALGDIKVFDLNPRQVQNFYDSLLDHKLSERSVHHIHRILSNALDYGARLGDLSKNVAKAAEPARVRKKEMKYWSIESLSKFINDTRTEQFYIAWYIASFTGMRQGEVLGLKWDCVDFSNKMIYVKRSLKRSEENNYHIADLKNNSSYRSISISDSDVFELKKHLNEQKRIKMNAGDSYIDNNLVVATSIGTHVLPSNLGRAFRRSIKQSKLNKIRFHDLRHTHASMLFVLGVHPKIVQERLGHSSIQVTLDTYSHMLPNMQEAVAESLESAFKKQQENKNSSSDFMSDVTNP